MSRLRRYAGVPLSLLLLTVAGAGTPPDGSSSGDGEWRLLGRTSDMQHYSPLRQIDRGNVSRLGLSWYADVDTRDGLAGNALVADGTVYQSGALGRIWAHDVRTGRIRWTFDAKVAFGSEGTIVSFWGSRINRGLALLDDKVFIGTGDCRLIAVKRLTGVKLWDVPACDRNGYYTITGAPRVGNGKVFIGNASMDTGGSRGYVSAFDARTGKELWRFYTVPGDPAKGFENAAMERAARTWGEGFFKTSAGGGSPWDAMTYDAKTDMLYVGTDGPSPFNPRLRGKGRGDELFTNSIVALDASTGAYRWHYQVTPNDAWNLSAAMHIMIADLPWGKPAKPRRVVMQAPKNGFFYVLDAASGELLSAKPIVRVSWASGIDMKTGRPVEMPEARYYANADQRALVYPGGIGAHNWQAMAFDPSTGLVFIPAADIGIPIEILPGEKGGVIGGALHAGYTDEMDRSPARDFGALIAWDPVAGRARWKVPMRLPTNGGVLSTAGGIVFAGEATGEVSAFDAATGKRLWRMQTGSAIQAAPTTVSVDGTQMLLVPVGTGGALNKMLPRYTLTPESRGPARLLAFALDAHSTLPPTPGLSAYVEPPLPRFSASMVRRGRYLFEQKGCDVCHGEAAIGGYGSVPDLRRSDAQVHELIGGIVIDGLRRSKGMPAFKDSVSVEELEAIQALMIDQAWNAYDAQQAAQSARKR